MQIQPTNKFRKALHLFSSLKLEYPKIDIVTIEDANLVLTQMGRVLNDRASTMNATQADILPAYGVRWEAREVQRINSHRLCWILRILRGAKMGEENCENLDTLRNDGRGDIINFHLHGEIGGHPWGIQP